MAELHGKPVGFATVFVPDDGAALLEYLAVEHGQRGAGIGSMLFHEAVRISLSAALLVEVESATDEASRRRIAFYVDKGCRILEGVRYILPLDTRPPPPELLLMIASGRLPPSRCQLRGWLEVIYQRVYGLAPNDERLDIMLKEFD